MISLKRKEDRLVIFLIVFAVFLIGFLYYLNIFDKPLYSRAYDVTFKVGDGIGFDLNDSSLSFGKMIPGSFARRELNVYNMYNFPIEIELKASREISDLLYLSERIIVRPNETKTFDVFLDVPKDYLRGEYAGKVIIDFRKSQ